MLVFVDESYKRLDDRNPKTTFAAVSVPEERYRELDNGLLALKRQYWNVDNHYQRELKGRLLLNRRGIRVAENVEFVEELQLLCRRLDIRMFAVVEDGTITVASESESLPRLYQGLIRRINTFMEREHRDDHAVVFFDGMDEATNARIAMSFNNFMFRHNAGIASRHVLPIAFFCNSRTTPPIQVSDVVAYCVNERYCGRRGSMETLFLAFRDLSYNYDVPELERRVWGFQGIAQPAPGGPEAPEAEGGEPIEEAGEEDDG